MTERSPAAIYADLPKLIRKRRGNLSFREAAAEAGVSKATLHRAESGHNTDAITVFRILQWLGFRFVEQQKKEKAR